MAQVIPHYNREVDVLDGVKNESIVANYQHHANPLVRALVTRIKTLSKNTKSVVESNSDAYSTGYRAGFEDGLAHARKHSQDFEARLSALQERANNSDPELVGELRGWY